jgi:hypothetical protein
MQFIFLGSSNRFFLKEIIEILRNVMNPDRDPEVRNQCLLIIANLLQFIDETDITKTIGPYLTILINECILPNMQWKAGRTAAAIRATAIATLWSLFQAKSFHFEQVRSKDVNYSYHLAKDLLRYCLFIFLNGLVN